MSATSKAAQPNAWRWSLLGALPLVVPILYLAFIIYVQPDARLGGPERWPWTHPYFYDDYDVAATVLRGLNAHLGRSAGRVDLPEELSPPAYDRALGEDRPLAPTYFLEYPHAALILFRLGWLIHPPPLPVPAAVLDGDYHNLVTYQPRDAREQRLWHAFRVAARINLGLMTAWLLALMVVLRVGYQNGELISTGALLLLPGALYFALNRFDVVPVLLTASSLACLGRRWWMASAVFLALGALVKVYPGLLAPLVVRYLWPERRAAWTWALTFAATGLVLLLPPLLTEGWQAVWAPYRFQLNREPLLDWTAYGCILPQRLAWNDPLGRVVRLGSLLALLALLLGRPIPNLSSLLRRGALLLIGFVTLAVFYSPQWILWLAPLLLPLVHRQRSLFWLVLALDVVTYLNWPLRLDWADLVVYARFAILGLLAFLLLRREWAEGVGSEVGEEANSLSFPTTHNQPPITS